MRVTYGVEVDEAEEDYLGIAEAAMTSFSSAFTPGKHLVEALPVLRFLPSWFPGTSGFRDEAKELMRTMLQLRDVPWRAAITAMVCCQKLLRKLFGVLMGVPRRDQPASEQGSSTSLYGFRAHGFPEPGEGRGSGRGR